MLDFTGKTRRDAARVMRRLFVRQAASAGVILLAGLILWKVPRGLYLALGLIWGLLDNALILGGTVRGFGTSPSESRKILIRIYLYRLLTGIILIVCMLKLKYGVFEAMAGFLLLHAALILNLKIFTGRKEDIKEEGDHKTEHP